jgi:hypothetical protein
MTEGIALLGEVVLGGRRLGWTLLDGDLGAFRAREVGVELPADLCAVGPVRLGEDQMMLLLASGDIHLIARTVTGAPKRTWTLDSMDPDVVPTVGVSHGSTVWVAGSEPMGGSPVIVSVGGRTFPLDPSSGDVCAATMHLDQLVLARLLAADDLTGAADSAEDPIDSIDASADGGVHSFSAA